LHERGAEEALCDTSITTIPLRTAIRSAEPSARESKNALEGDVISMDEEDNNTQTVS
jgi:hypothetical protein